MDIGAGLIAACQCGRGAVVLALLSLAADPSTNTDLAACGPKVFQLACREGYSDLVRLLADSLHTYPWASGSDGLAAAVYRGHAAVVEALFRLPHGHRMRPSRVPSGLFKHACTEGNARIVAAMLALTGDARVDAGVDDNAALYAACEHGHAAVVDLLLALPPDRGVDATARDGACLWEACDANSPAVVASLLARPEVDPGMHDNYCLQSAAAAGYTRIVQLLLALPLDRGVDPAANGNYAVRHAWGAARADIVRLLAALPLSRGVDMAFLTQSAFNRAVQRCAWGLVQVALPFAVQLQISLKALADAPGDVRAELAQAYDDAMWRGSPRRPPRRALLLSRVQRRASVRARAAAAARGASSALKAP